MASWRDTYEQLKKRKKQIDEGISTSNAYSTNKGKVSLPTYTNNNTQLAPLPSVVPLKTTVTMPTTKKKEEERTYFQKGLFDDGYDFGDITKTILGTMEDVKTSFKAGTYDLVETGIDSVATLVGKGAEIFGKDEFADKTKKFIAKDLIDEEKLSKFNIMDIASDTGKVIGENLSKGKAPTLKDIKDEIFDESYKETSVFGDKTDSLIRSAGQMTTQQVLQSFFRVPWQVTSGITSFGGEAENAFKNGSDYNDAIASASISAAAEIITGNLFKIPGLSASGTGTISKLINNGFGEKISNTALRNLVNWGINIGGESLEETATSFFQRLGQALTYEREDTLKELFEDEEKRDAYVKQLGKKLFGEEAREEYKEAAVGGAVFAIGGGAPRVYTSTKAGRDYETGLTTDETVVVEAETNRRIEAQEQAGKKLTAKEKAKIEEQVTQEVLKKFSTKTTKDIAPVNTTETVEDIDNQIVALEEQLMKTEDEAEYERLSKQIQELENKAEQIENGTYQTASVGQINQPTTQEVEINSPTEVDSNTQVMETNPKRRNFTYDSTKVTNEYAQATYESASKVMNDTERSHKFVDVVAKISTEKNTKYEFTNNEDIKSRGYDIEGKQVNGLVTVEENGETKILINIDSPKALNTIVGHETTHLLEGTQEYKELQKAVFEYAKTKGEFNDRQAKLHSLYKNVKGANVDSELTADLVGDYLFTDSKFIESLSIEKPTLFQKLKELIDDLVVKFTGTKEEKQLREVQKKFREAYRQETTKINTKNKYALNDKYKTKQLTSEAMKKFNSEGANLTTIYDANNVYIIENNDYSEYNILKRIPINGNEKYISEIQKELKNNANQYRKSDSTNSSNLEFETRYDNRNNASIEGQSSWSEFIDRVLETVEPEQFGRKNNNKQSERINEELDDSSFFNAKYSISDNQGRELTKEQQEFFKDSKVRDENGNLLTMYHGTPNGNFTAFKGSNYFTSNKEYADVYQNPSASSISSGKTVDNPSTYEVYLNIKKPFDTKNDPVAREIFENEFYMKWGNGSPLMESGYPDWVEGMDLQEFIEENGYDYDGLILDEGAIGGFGDEVQSRGLSYVTFNSNQIKNVDNTNPTSNEDIRYSLSDTNLKQKQLEIIQKENPMTDDYHTGIRTIDDIKTFDETIDDDESFVWGDFSQEDAKKALEKGEVTVYSSYPIEQGVFVSTSKNQARDYAGSGKVYSKTVPLNEVAWINGDEGQYAKVESENYSLSNQEEQIAPTGDYNVYGEEVKLEEVIAPLQEEIQTLTETVKELKQQIAPVQKDIYEPTTMDDLEGWEAQTREVVTNQDIAPTRNNLTEVESQELDTLEDIPFELTAEEQARKNELEMKERNSYYMNDTMSLDKKSLKALSKNIKDSLGLNNKQKLELENVIQEYSMQENASREDLYEIIEDKFGKQNVETKLDDIIDAQTTIRKSKIKPTDDLRQMTDYFQIKQKNFGKISMSNNGMEVDKVYQELSETYKDLFPDTITNPADQFERIIEVANMSKTSLEEITLPEDVIQDVTDFVYESVQDYKYSEYVKDSNSMYKDGWENINIPFEEVNETVPELKVSPKVKPRTTNKNVDWDALEDTSKGTQQQYDLESQTINDETISELEKKKQRELKKLGKKEDYISNKASELYDELKSLRKGTKASYELSNILDFSFANINELTKGKTDTAIKEIKSKIYRNITTGLLNVESKPSTIVNENSKIEAKIRENISREYDSKVAEINNLKEENLKTKKQIKQDLLRKTGIMNESLDEANRLPKILMENTDPIRLQEMIFGRGLGEEINKMFFYKVKDNTSEKIRFQNKERAEIKGLGIKARSKESAAVQKYGEKQWTNEAGETLPYGDKELASEFPNVETQNKIKRASEVIRQKYDNYLDETNKVLTSLGYDAIPKRKDYMRHFQELNDIFTRVGIPYNYNEMTANDLPTDINGLTADFSPSKNFFASALRRKGVKTTYDAITGIDGYLEGIGNLIYHTEDIQRLRALEEYIRDTYGENHGFDNLENLTDQEKATRIEKIQDNHLSNYASWLHEYTNTLAGKKSLIDRSVESLAGRRIYSFLNTTKSQVGKNMIGFNLSSAMTNIVAEVQALAKTNKLATVKGLSDTVKNIFIKDGFTEKNNFLTSRFGSDMLSKNLWQRMGDAGFIFMQGTDNFISQLVVRSKYNELKAKGLSDTQAHDEAGKFAARLMGDRSQGATANIYNSQMLGLVTQFQLEVNNQLYSMFYDTYHESKEQAQGKALKTAAGMTYTLGQLAVFTHLFGKGFEAMAGYNPTFDIIGMLMTAFGLDDEEEDEDTTAENLGQAFDKLVDALPYVNILTGGGRIPVSEALPLEELFTGKDEFGNDKPRLETLKEALPYYVLPSGYGQLKKTSQGLAMYDEDLPIAGSYTDSGNLRFTADDSTWGKVQAGIFGQWASDEAQAYVDSEFKSIDKENINELVDLGMTSSEYRKLKADINKVGETKNDKGYIKYTDENDNAYWYDKKTQTLYDSNNKESNLSILDLTKADSKQQKIEYIDSLDLTTDQKNILVNNMLSDNLVDEYGYQKYIGTEINKKGKEVEKTYWYDEKNDILYDSKYKEVRSSLLDDLIKAEETNVDMGDYDDFSTYEEFDFSYKNPKKYEWLQENDISYDEYTYDEDTKEIYDYAYNNPETFKVGKAITGDFVAYKEYTDYIYDLKADKDRNGKSISGSRKTKVISYVNELDLSIPQKAMLIRQEYSTFDDYNYDIVDYVDNLDIDYEDKVSILESLDMKVDDEGNISW